MEDLPKPDWPEIIRTKYRNKKKLLLYRSALIIKFDGFTVVEPPSISSTPHCIRGYAAAHKYSGFDPFRITLHKCCLLETRRPPSYQTINYLLDVSGAMGATHISANINAEIKSRRA
jgi:hypothetical protein